MTHSIFLSVDPGLVQAIEYTVFLSDSDANFGFDILFEVESEDEDFGIAGLDHLRKAIIASRVYEQLKGCAWKNIKEIVYGDDRCGALVEFRNKEEAMLWKLSQG